MLEEKEVNEHVTEQEENHEQEVVIDIHAKYDETITFEDSILPSPNESNKGLESDSASKLINHMSSSYETTQSTSSQINEHHQECIDTSQCNMPVLKTSLRKALKVVIGHTEELQHLDNQHFKLKQMIKHNKRDKHLEQNYEALANIQVKVLSEKSAAERKLKAWKKEYVINHDLKPPSTEDMKKENHRNVLLKQIKHADAMLRNWKIKF